MPRQRQTHRLTMRPDRFTHMLATATNSDGKLTAATYADAGITRSLWGLIITGTANADVQIIARSAIGDDYSQTEQPVTGEPHPPVQAAAPASIVTLEQYLASLAVTAAPGEIRTVDRYSQREKPQAIRYGITFGFHSGAAIFVYITEKD